jgi:hypothetical protein
VHFVSALVSFLCRLVILAVKPAKQSIQTKYYFSHCTAWYVGVPLLALAAAKHSRQRHWLSYGDGVNVLENFLYVPTEGLPATNAGA